MDKSVIERYPRYENYKDSEYEWIGVIPLDWIAMPNKYLFDIINNKVGKNSNEYDLLSLTLKGIIKRDMINAQGKFPAEFDTYQEVKKDDFVFCFFDVEETPRTVGLSKYNGMITGAYTVLRLNDEYDKKFIYYYYLNLDLDKRFKPLYRGLRNTIPKDWFMSFKTYFPPFSQQTKIANFLDLKTAQIDQAITLKQQQIIKLEEYKQIVIQNAVTKGLNPDVPMIDSGIDWIGKIPEHWEVKKLKRLASINPKVSLNHLEYNDYVTFLPMEKVTVNGDIDCSIKRPLHEVKQGLTSFQKNDVILAKITPCFENGKGAFLDDLETTVGFGSTEFHVIRANKNIDKLFLYNITQSAFFLKIGEKMMVGSAGQKRVPTDFVSNYQLALPPLSEQGDINNYIVNVSNKVHESIRVQNTQIDRLKEYKTILINQAVTGKIKVS